MAVVRATVTIQFPHAGQEAVPCANDRSQVRVRGAAVVSRVGKCAGICAAGLVCWRLSRHSRYVFESQHDPGSLLLCGEAAKSQLCGRPLTAADSGPGGRSASSVDPNLPTRDPVRRVVDQGAQFAVRSLLCD